MKTNGFRGVKKFRAQSHGNDGLEGPQQALSISLGRRADPELQCASGFVYARDRQGKENFLSLFLAFFVIDTCMAGMFDLLGMTSSIGDSCTWTLPRCINSDLHIQDEK